MWRAEIVPALSVLLSIETNHLFCLLLMTCFNLFALWCTYLAIRSIKASIIRVKVHLALGAWHTFRYPQDHWATQFTVLKRILLILRSGYIDFLRYDQTPVLVRGMASTLHPVKRWLEIALAFILWEEPIFFRYYILNFESMNVLCLCHFLYLWLHKLYLTAHLLVLLLQHGDRAVILPGKTACERAFFSRWRLTWGWL